jgi:hypothetical protein
MAQDLKRAMILVGGLDEEVARGFWSRKGHRGERRLLPL